jgi:hypothetical protein
MVEMIQLRRKNTVVRTQLRRRKYQLSERTYLERKHGLPLFRNGFLKGFYFKTEVVVKKTFYCIFTM